MGRGSLTMGVARGRLTRPGLLTGLQLGLALVVALVTIVKAETGGKFGYFSQENNSHVLIRNGEWDISVSGHQAEFSFRTCSNGEFLYQRGASGDFLLLTLINGTLEFHWKIGDFQSTIFIGNDMNNDEWWTVSSQGYLGNAFLNVSRGGRVFFSEIISNSTFRNYFENIDFGGTEGLYVGKGFTGCLMEGPTVIFSTFNINRDVHNVIWSNTSCLHNDVSCAIENGDIDDCYSHPCNNGGTCIDGTNSYTCQCPHLYNGTNCENDLSIYGCLVDPCLNGGTCVNETSGTKNYRCICPNGFAGGNCEGNIDECGTNPCDNDTPCIDTVGGYECNCTGSGYNGTSCEVDIDECLQTDICGAGQCFNNPGGFTCDCPLGFFGEACQDIDECSSNPCQNGATCQNGDNAFQCNCPLGYSGIMCETDINDCLNVVCSDANTECRDLVNNHECVCKPGYTGGRENCTEINECTLYNPCKNGATCQDLVNNYTCDCVPGYDGKNCSNNIDECAGNPCRNGATCIDGINRYTCQCATGYDGDTCNNNINECARYSEPCFHGGTCNDGIGEFNCSCLLGYTGSRCETDINECASNPCGENSITCTHGIGYYNCTCKSGFTGNQCQTDINECSSNPCYNGAACMDEVNGFRCTCTSEWMGSLCNIEYNACSPDFENCKNGATCQTIPRSRDFNCTCLSGFNGIQCENNIDDCRPDSCVPPLQCYDGINNVTCACPLGYEGINCSNEIQECASNPCKNGATCIDGIGNYTCQCNQHEATVPDEFGNRTFLTGYEGTNCDIDINECAIQPTICLNGGDCQNEQGAFQCKCGRDLEGNFFSGSHCEVSTTYCVIHQEVQGDPPACKNNGTCKGLTNDFMCTCAPGFTGRRCETNIDECESSPCQYNGTCIDGINQYTCDCIPGITGDNCEIDIDECHSNPCLHGGQCIDQINGYVCNCSDTGFKGDTCQINIDDCESQPCMNDGTCSDLIKDFDCTCFTGYNGKQCENDINECASSPCQFDSICLERSNQTLYQINHPGFEGDFSYFNASGYLCECVPGSTGVNCEVNIDDCQHDNCLNGATCVDELNGYHCDCMPGYEDPYCQTEINECLRYTPCKHGSTCTDKIADYDCACPPLYNGKPYSGKNCTFELTSCLSNQCQSGSTCQPYLIDESTASQDYRCLCAIGFTGRYCNISTTMTFNTSTSNIKSSINVSSETNSVSVRFRTTLRDAILFGWIGESNGLNRLFTTVELKDGLVYIGYNDDGSGLKNISVSDLLMNDAKWHSLELTKYNGTITVSVSHMECSTSACSVMVSYSSDVLETADIYFGSFGGSKQALLQQTVSQSGYVGCMEDVTIQGTRLALSIQSGHSFTSIEQECQRSPPCHRDTCNMKGQCIDLWNTYRCECYRPSLGNNCETAYIAATFGYHDKGSSSAEFDLPSDISQSLTQGFDLSFFFRTRQPTSKILFYGDIRSGTYLTMAMQDGKVEIIVNFCNSPKTLESSNLYNDGNQHLVRFYYSNGNTFQIHIDGNSEYSEIIWSPCSFQSSSVYFGGSVPSALRRKRRDTFTSMVNSGSTINDYTNKDHYKGTIQDVQLSSMSLQFYPLSDPTLSDLTAVNITKQTNLTENETSDPVCAMISPCENNSTCSDVFFNDYSCECLLGYRGKNCSELDFCVTGECPVGSTCQSLLDGFECISNATFDGRTDFAVYKNTLSNTSIISAFSFKFRTLAMNGYILMFGDNNEYFKVMLRGSYVILEYKLPNSAEVVLSAEYDISNSNVYLVEVREHDLDMTLTLYDSDKVFQHKMVNGTLPTTGNNFMNGVLKKSNTDVILGTRIVGVAVNSYIYAYHGCLSEVRIGGILLPFFPDDQFINNTSVERFLLQSNYRFTQGCQAGIGCDRNQCKHGSQCQPDFYSYTCECSTGYTGRWCQDRVDFCSDNPCMNGHCVNLLDQYQCMCDNTGYTGTRCETDINECSDNSTPCLNKGLCMNQNGTYTCQCSSSFIGDNCEIPVGNDCSDSPCVHGTCTNTTIEHPAGSGTMVQTYQCMCTAGYTGVNCDTTIDYCAEYPCSNNGTCASNTNTQNFTCTCPTGFEGLRCEINKDDCPLNACQNGGECVDGVNSYACNCTKFYEGADCSIPIDECSRTQQCQNSGVCRNRNGASAFCACAGTGYEGLYCDEDIDECKDTNTCKNDASCTNTDGSFICNCTLGYEGKDCGTPNCNLVNCLNSATCTVANQQWKCVCPDYYEGELCEIKGPCADEPCVTENTQTCVQNISENTYVCNCKTGWTGQDCHVDVDECNLGTDLCQNGATCVNINGGYECSCVLGYQGQFCSIDINECASSPCQNNGICLDLIGRFECNCTNTGYTNETCADDIDECFEDNPCYNGATCTNTEGSFTCTCSDGWEGITCRDKIKMDDDITWYIVGPVVGLLLISITIGIICFLFCVRNKRATRGAYSPSRQEVTGSRVELGNVMKKPPLERLI
ncbi:DNA repair protein Rad9 [Mactra antiquata]